MANDKDDEPKDQNKVRAKATGDLDKVTDYVEEREMDAEKVAASMRTMLGNASATKKKIDPDLMNVKIQQADVKAIVDELDVDEKVAERALRKAGGDIVQALRDLIN